MTAGSAPPGAPTSRDAGRDAGSFRDPAGHVFVLPGEVVRSVHPCAAAAFRQVLDSGLLDELATRGLMIATTLDDSGRDPTPFTGARGETPAYLLLHPRLRFTSYAHEWTFSQLQDAALAHLDVHLLALARGMTLSDASAHNMQFHRGRPLHIDPLSLRPYVDGEPWAGYNQFCRMFLLPLLLEAWTGVGFQPLLRGSVDGIPLAYGAQLLPWHKRLTSLNGMLHVFAHAKMTQAVTSSRAGEAARAAPAVPKARTVALLQELRRWIAGLQSRRNRGGAGTYWGEYATINSYSPAMQQTKAGFVATFAQALAAGATAPTLVCDIGGNTGEYAQVAVDHGVSEAIVFDSDLDALEKAYARCKSGQPVLPLLMDIADPSAAMGWDQAERKGLKERRGGVSGVLALAVIHHLCIGRNLPLRAVVHWLVDFAPQGVIEFVPKADPMVVGMLATREDLFGDYDEAHFMRYLQEVATAGAQLRFEENGRLLVHYTRHG